MLKNAIKSSAIIFFGIAIPVAYHSSSSSTFEFEKSNTNQDTKNQNNVK